MDFLSFITGVCDNDPNEIESAGIQDGLDFSGDMMEKKRFGSLYLVLLMIMTATLMLTSIFHKREVEYAINTDLLPTRI